MGVIFNPKKNSDNNFSFDVIWIFQTYQVLKVCKWGIQTFVQLGQI